MPYKLTSVFRSTDGSELKPFFDHSSEEDKIVWEDYANYVVSVASSKYNRSAKIIEMSNTTHNVSSYIFPTLEDAQNYLKEITDFTNPYVKNLNDVKQEYLANGAVNSILTRTIYEID